MLDRTEAKAMDSGRARSSKGLINTFQLEVTLLPPTGQQQRAIDDALRILATWALRAAQGGAAAQNSGNAEATLALTSGRPEVMNVAND